MGTNAVTQKNGIIDYLKAFAITLVVMHHVITYINIDADVPFMKVVLDLIQSVHVPLFFCIAGYLCHKQNLKGYFVKKVYRILIPFLTFTILKLIYTTFISDAFAHAKTTHGRIKDAFLCGSLYWFIYPMLLFFLFAPVLWNLRKGNILIFVGLIAMNAYIGDPTFYILQIGPAFFHACFFVAGILIQQNEKMLATFVSRYRKVIFALCIGIVLVCSALLYGDYMGYSFLVKVVLGFPEMYLLLLIANKLPNDVTPLEVMGRYSLQIMFFDSFFKVALFGLLERFLTVNVFTSLLTIPVNILLGCVVCAVIKRIPYVRKLFGL